MKARFGFDRIEQQIIHDEKLLFTLISYAIILLIFANLSWFQSPLLGFFATAVYFLINGVFLGNAFFVKETRFFRLMFGLILLIMLLGFVGWLTLVIYNLDIMRFTLVLFVAATVSSLLNRRMKNKDVTW